MTGVQCKAARALLGWLISDLAARSGVTLKVISKFETGQTVRPLHVEWIQTALERAGIVFLNNRGVYVLPSV